MNTSAEPKVWEIRVNRLAIEQPSQDNLSALEQGIMGIVRAWVKDGWLRKLALSVNGYGDDPRELYEIPEVCTWARAMVECMPSLWFFLDDASRDRLIGWLCGPVSRKEIESPEFLERLNQKQMECSTAAVAASSGFLERAGASTSQISSFYFKEMNRAAAKRAAEQEHSTKKWWQFWK